MKLVNENNLRYGFASRTVNASPNKNLINQNNDMINNKDIIYRRIQNRNNPKLINYRNINIKNKIVLRPTKSQNISKINNLNNNTHI